MQRNGEARRLDDSLAEILRKLHTRLLRKKSASQKSLLRKKACPAKDPTSGEDKQGACQGNFGARLDLVHFDW